MGSKVSSKMAAPAARVIQAVRPHAPLIKFPKRQDVARPNVQEALKTLAVNASPHNAPAPPPLSRPHVPLTPISGTPDTLASIQLLPARYRRRPMAVDEMDYIQIRILFLFLLHSVVDQSDMKQLNHCNQRPYLLEISMRL
ncbi:alpha-ketoglutarate dehydrogenase component 4 isoform X1 [Sander vitreus]